MLFRSPTASANQDAGTGGSGKFPLPSSDMPVPDLGLGQPESSSKEGSAAPSVCPNRPAPHAIGKDISLI